MRNVSLYRFDPDLSLFLFVVESVRVNARPGYIQTFSYNQEDRTIVCSGRKIGVNESEEFFRLPLALFNIPPTAVVSHVDGRAHVPDVSTENVDDEMEKTVNLHWSNDNGSLSVNAHINSERKYFDFWMRVTTA
jgi:hypothetical protein